MTVKQSFDNWILIKYHAPNVKALPISDELYRLLFQAYEAGYNDKKNT